MRTLLRFALGALLSLTGCGHDPTEVVAVVDGEFATPSEVDSLVFTITAPNGETRTATAELTTGAFPRTLGIVKGSGGDGAYVLLVEAKKGGGTVVSRRARFQFDEGSIRMLRIDLLRACKFVSCTGNTTCGEGGFCERADVTLEPWHGDPAPRFDGGTSALVMETP